MKAPFRPLRAVDGYLPIEDHGLIGDGVTAALVARDGAVAWLCAPRFDDPALFCRMLDAERGGEQVITIDALVESRQEYLEDTGVLVTELRSPTGVVRLTDCLTVEPGARLAEPARAARHELLRHVEVLEGSVCLQVRLTPRGGARCERSGDGLRITCARRPELPLWLFATVPLEGLETNLELRAGATFTLKLSWAERPEPLQDGAPEALLQGTLRAWREWMSGLRYDGPQQALVRRSAIALKLLDYFEQGAIVAAPTSSLPEAIGGERNWDYRYTWIRDAAFSVYALRRIGLQGEAWSFLTWVLDTVGEGRPQVLYDLNGRRPQAEFADPELSGYRGSQPVRWGNAAADQRQHDVYGELLDCAYQWVAGGGQLAPRLWASLRRLVEASGKEWDQPDHGIWEVRVPGRVFTYSAAMCQLALDRGARIATKLGLDEDVSAWAAQAASIREAIIERAWSERRQSFTEHLSAEGGLDGSLLALPLRRVVRADHPRMIATTQAVVSRLGAGQGLLYRYLPDESPDGVEGHEGAFLLCSFWLVDNLALQGRLDEAVQLYDSLCARAGPLGLLPEQIDPGTGAFLGNYPQAFSHVGVISSGITLSRALRGERR
ncbi:MAG: glycoside hydrolase family 15 protein [Archangium sp.]|nr:glycoside hydrolase family 15 protein [Archangium sp.]MDP3571312.1 glycoside hydrolase family 15 protein [Archangium sp.]